MARDIWRRRRGVRGLRPRACGRASRRHSHAAVDRCPGRLDRSHSSRSRSLRRAAGCPSFAGSLPRTSRHALCLTTAASRLSRGRDLPDPAWTAQQEELVQVPDRQHRVQNTIGWRQRLAHFRGSPVVFDLTAYGEELADINHLGMDLEALSDREIRVRAAELREHAGGSRESIRAAFFALAREASRRGAWSPSIRCPGPRRDRAGSRPHRRDADRRRKNARCCHAGGACRSHRPGRACLDVQ